MKKNDTRKGVENDRGTSLKTVVRKDFSEEAIFAQKPERVREFAIWIQGKKVPTEGTSRGRHFLAYCRNRRQGGWSAMG